MLLVTLRLKPSGQVIGKSHRFVLHSVGDKYVCKCRDLSKLTSDKRNFNNHNSNFSCLGN